MGLSTWIRGNGDGLPPKVVRTLKRGPSEQDATSRIEGCLGGLPLLLRTVRARLKGLLRRLAKILEDDLEHGEVIGVGGALDGGDVLDEDVLGVDDLGCARVWG